MFSISKLTASFVTALSLTTACVDLGGPEREPDAPVLDLIEERLGPARRSYVVDGQAGGPIEGDAISFVIPRGALVDPSGARVSGPVTVAMREFNSAGDMVRGGRPTVTRDGELLESSGSFDFELSGQRGQPLLVSGLEDLVFRNWRREWNAGMELWVAAPDDDTWVRPAAEPILAQNRGNDYRFDTAPGRTDIKAPNAYNADSPLAVRRALNGANDDGRVTLKVQFDAELAANAGVFFLPADGATAAKLATRDLALPGYASAAGAMPAGVTGRLIVVALDDGRYYLHHDEAYVIPSGAPGSGGTKEATVHVTPIEVSEADFMAYLAGL